MLLASSDVQRLLESVLTGWARQDVVAAARRAAADGRPDVDLWPRLVDLGLLELPVPVAHGGTGGSLDDLAVVLERLGYALLPGAYLPTAAAAVVLAGSAQAPGVARALAEIAAGSTTAAVAVDRGVVVDGDGRLGGNTGLAFGAAETALAIVCEAGRDGRCFLVGCGDPGVTVARRTAVDLTRSLAEIRLDGVRPRVALTGISAGFVRDVLLTCLAAEAAGIVGWCVETAVEYAKVRRQFGRPIGSFQAVKHLCAEMAVLRESAAAAAWDAASCFGDPEQLELAAAAAGDVALDAALEAAKACIQVLGGIGCTWEHDAHLYLRRAAALRLAAGPRGYFRRHLGRLAVSGRRRTPPPLVDQESDAYAAAQSFADRIAVLPPAGQRRAMADEGYLVPGWPEPFGRGADPTTTLAIAGALADAGVKVPDLVIGNWLVRAIVDHGNDDQRQRFVPPTLRGELSWCQLFSEPEAGSDLASLRTRATRVIGGWRIDGQKIWTSLARDADWGFCLARTDPEAPQRKGITAFLVDMAAAGISVRPIREMSGETRFNEVFLDGVVVPEDAVVGEVNAGWLVATSALATERVAMGSRETITPAMGRLLDALTADKGAREEWLDTVGGLFSRSLVKSANDRRVAVAGMSGAAAGPLPLVAKLTGVRLAQDEREAVLLVHGLSGALDEGEQRAWVRDFLSGRALSIAGGSSQILLNLLAERVLGLPRGD